MKTVFLNNIFLESFILHYSNILQVDIILIKFESL